MKFIVTGGAGFIGSHIVMQLLDQGHDVVIIDNHSRGRVENLKNYDQRFDFINMDIADIEKSKKILYDLFFLDPDSKLGLFSMMDGSWISSF